MVVVTMKKKKKEKEKVQGGTLTGGSWGPGRSHGIMVRGDGRRTVCGALCLARQSRRGQQPSTRWERSGQRAAQGAVTVWLAWPADAQRLSLATVAPTLGGTGHAICDVDTA